MPWPASRAWPGPMSWACWANLHSTCVASRKHRRRASEARPKQASALPVEVPLAQFGGAALGAAARSGALAGALGAGPNGANGANGASGAGAGGATGATRRDLGPFGGSVGRGRGRALEATSTTPWATGAESRTPTSCGLAVLTGTPQGKQVLGVKWCGPHKSVPIGLRCLPPAALWSKLNRQAMRVCRISLLVLSFRCSTASLENLACPEGEACEDSLQQSFLQHAALLSQPLEPLKGICDTVKTPPYSPYADEINQGRFYVMALTNDTSWNPAAFGYVSWYNFRIVLQGHRGKFVGFYMAEKEVDSDWSVFNFSAHTRQPEALRLLKVDAELCKVRNRDCQYSQWHAEIWKSHPLMINWSCGGSMVGNEVLWGGGPKDPDLLPYAWSLIKAQGGGMERFPLIELASGPHSKPCPW